MSVGHKYESCKNGRTDRNAVWGVDRWPRSHPCGCGQVAEVTPLREGALLGGQTCACPDVPAVDILNVIREEHQLVGGVQARLVQ